MFYRDFFYVCSGIFNAAFLPPLEAVKRDDKNFIHFFPEKDEDGHMEFTIVGTNTAGRAIGVYAPLTSTENKPEVNKVYYLAYSKTIKGKFPRLPPR